MEAEDSSKLFYVCGCGPRYGRSMNLSVEVNEPSTLLWNFLAFSFDNREWGPLRTLLFDSPGALETQSDNKKLYERLSGRLTGIPNSLSLPTILSSACCWPRPLLKLTKINTEMQKLCPDPLRFYYRPVMKREKALSLCRWTFISQLSSI